MNLEELYKVLEKNKLFRKKQVEKALFYDNINSWQEATVLPLELRGELEQRAPICFDFDLIASADESNFKAVLQMEDGVKIETVLLRHEDGRNSVCVSSQAGCPMGCIFCRTAVSGLARNLTSYEIIGQVLFFSYFLKNKGAKVTNIIFMGMGEPFLNYGNVLGAIRILNNRGMFDIGARKISVSTCGITEGIEKLASEDLQINLAVSLNAPDDNLRAKIMPVNNRYPVQRVIDAVKKYIKATNRRVMFEYVLLDGINDSPQQAIQLSVLLKDMLCFVNLIPYNGGEGFKSPSDRKTRQFKHILKSHHISVTKRYEFGRDINAACGQLVYKNR